MEKISVDGDQVGSIGKFVATNGGEAMPLTKRKQSSSLRSKILL